MTSTWLRRSFFWWWCIPLVAVCTFGLGWWGFREYFSTPGLQRPPSDGDSVYRALQIFFLNWEPLVHPIPWQLQVARFLGAFVALSAVFAALWELFHERLRRLILRWFYRRHVVLCGLGQGGVELVTNLRNRGRRVVVIESQEGHPGLGPCREQRAMVLIGSPSDPWNLREARIDRAEMLLSLFQDDAASIETFVQAHHLCAGREAGSLRCVLQVFDHEIRDLLRRHPTLHNPQAPTRLNLFNLLDVGAQVMLQESPVLYATPEPRRFLMVGMGWLGQTLLVRLARGWRVDQLDGHPTPAGGRKVIVIDRDTAGLEARLRNACPSLAGVCQLDVQEPMDVQGEKFQAGKFLPQQDTGNTVDAAFVCLPDDRLALLTAFRLRERFGPRVPLIVSMTSREGLAQLLAAQTDPHIHVIGLRELTCTLHLVTTATEEMLAREVHRDYVQDQMRRDPNWPANPSMVPWHQLPEGLQESNRQAAADVWRKLEEIHWEAIPVREVRELRRLPEDDVDRLARQEHERWYRERWDAGWRYGEVKDVERKLSPSLVDYDKLPEAAKETNRAAVRRIPVWLARAGFEIRVAK
jgi:hypothetical protein